MNNVDIEQVDVTKLLGVTLDCKLLWSKHIDTTVSKMGRSMFIIKCCSKFLTALSMSYRPFVTPGLLFSPMARYHKKMT
jgi:hypothetical protein